MTPRLLNLLFEFPPITNRDIADEDNDPSLFPLDGHTTRARNMSATVAAAAARPSSRFPSTRRFNAGIKTRTRGRLVVRRVTQPEAVSYTHLRAHETLR